MSRWQAFSHRRMTTLVDWLGFSWDCRMLLGIVLPNARRLCHDGCMFSHCSFLRSEIGNWSYLEIFAEIFVLGSWHLINGGDFFGIRKFSFRCKHIADIFEFCDSRNFHLFTLRRGYISLKVKDDCHVPVINRHIGTINENVIHDHFPWCDRSTFQWLVDTPRIGMLFCMAFEDSDICQRGSFGIRERKNRTYILTAAIVWLAS